MERIISIGASRNVPEHQGTEHRGFSLEIAPLLPRCSIKDGWDVIMFITAGLIFFHVFRFYSSRTKCLQISRIDRC